MAVVSEDREEQEEREKLNMFRESEDDLFYSCPVAKIDATQTLQITSSKPGI